jgi:hypothetical protein
MASKLVRANSRTVLIAAGVAFLVLAMSAAQSAIVMAHRYQIPLWMVSGGAIRDVILGLGLVFFSIRRSKFAGAMAVIAATFLLFGLALRIFTSLASASVHFSWWNGIDVALAIAILWPSIFPWSRSANTPVLFWMTLTFGALTLVFGTVAILARL